MELVLLKLMTSVKVALVIALGLSSMFTFEMQDRTRRDISALKVNVDTVVIEIDDEGEASGKGPDDVHIIDLDAACENSVVENEGSPEKIWNYLDPSGNVQGPFSIRTLEYWMEEGFFDEDFRIWKDSQSQEDAIPLGVALGLLQ
ncbi:hypothetical protein M5K25_019931 [Dendrobium thyrsiflorum]|uniref:GYF domain-containing protein n=1 Tax=Dendrobium thyrsiflorum TaxID=117978 RepID=A0ABD0UGR3_DENTH